MSITSTRTGLFYAYVKHINDDWSARFIITFATRDIAETWFRLVTDSVARGYPRFRSVLRVSLQFFTHNPNEGTVRDTITDDKVARQLLGKVFFTQIRDRDGPILSIIPILNYTEYKSGDRFFIRSSSGDDAYWYYEQSTGSVLASQTRRTKFTVTIADRKRDLGTTIIDNDDVYLTVDPNINIGVSSEGDLKSIPNPSSFRFSCFSTDFQVEYYTKPDANLGMITSKPGKGDKWELV